MNKCARKPACVADAQGRRRACNPETGRCKIVDKNAVKSNVTDKCAGKPKCPPSADGRERACNPETGRCKLVAGKILKPNTKTKQKLQIDIDIDRVIDEMRPPRRSVPPFFGPLQGITREARDEIAKVVGPLYYHGVVPKESWYGGVAQLVTTSQGKTPLHVVEDILLSAGHSARDRGMRNSQVTIDASDIRRVLDADPEFYDFTLK